MSQMQAQVVQDPETQEYFLTFPPELITQLEWQIEDTLEWTEKEDGSILIKNINAEKRKNTTTV